MNILASAFIAAGFMFWGCSTPQAPEPDTVLRLTLNDSLSRYERVQIQLLDLEKDSALVKELWNSPLTAPATQLALATHSLKEVSGDAFLVRVRGFSNGDQLALETHIIREKGRTTVTHVAVAPLVPRNRLSKIKPSVGLLSPLFHKDSLEYRVSMPIGVESISFELTAAYSGASISFQGDSVKSGFSTKPVSVGTTEDSCFIRVTDLVGVKASTLTYKLILVPTEPPELLITEITPSAGVLNPPFTPEQTSYNLQLPLGIDSVSFKIHPADPATMTLTFMEKVIFPGEKSPLVIVSDASPGRRISIRVMGGGEEVAYQVAVLRTESVP